MAMDFELARTGVVASLAKRLLVFLLVAAVFLLCVLAGYLVGNTAVGGVLGVFASALIADLLTGCGVGLIRRRRRR